MIPCWRQLNSTWMDLAVWHIPVLNVSLPQHDTFLGHICVNSKARHISWRTPALPQQTNKKKTHNACRNQSLIPKVNYNLRIWYKMSNIWTGYSLGIENWFDWCFWCEFVPWNHTNENNASHWIKEVLICTQRIIVRGEYSPTGDILAGMNRQCRGWGTAESVKLK